MLCLLLGCLPRCLLQAEVCAPLVQRARCGGLEGLICNRPKRQACHCLDYLVCGRPGNCPNSLLPLLLCWRWFDLPRLLFACRGSCHISALLLLLRGLRPAPRRRRRRRRLCAVFGGLLGVRRGALRRGPGRGRCLPICALLQALVVPRILLPAHGLATIWRAFFLLVADCNHVRALGPNLSNMLKSLHHPNIAHINQACPPVKHLHLQS
mmetsp:Transcript_52771/g.138415  ORF Transcript_52771/g.138415 Transcript_52771/m.138415 type:complete len:210 (-) Transcript_52771:299-928(-)